jgi:uncharacterized protein (DUF1778 family)
MANLKIRGKKRKKVSTRDKSGLSDLKTVRFELRLTERQQQLIEQAARLLGYKTSTDYIRQSMHENSSRVIREQTILEIAERDRERFMEELTNPGEPGNALKKAARRYQIFAGK